MLLKDKRIFIIEDNLENRVIMQMLLEMQGAKVGFERWGTTALRHLRSFAPIDVVLLDLMFPNNVTGYDVFDLIRSEPTLVDVPVLAVSASDPSIAVPKTRAKGFAGFISKPVDFGQFASQVARFICDSKVY